MLPYLQAFEPAFLGHAADRLNARIGEQTALILAGEGIKTPVSSASVMLFLELNGPATVADIARADGQSHQTVTARVLPLLRMKLVEKRPDPGDQRKVRMMLTQAGRADARKLRQICAALARAMKQLSAGSGIQLYRAISEAETELQRWPLQYRLDLEARKETQ
jgi:DNA-binding MarR family transcriptional regulator